MSLHFGSRCRRFVFIFLVLFVTAVVMTVFSHEAEEAGETQERFRRAIDPELCPKSLRNCQMALICTYQKGQQTYTCSEVKPTVSCTTTTTTSTQTPTTTTPATTKPPDEELDNIVDDLSNLTDKDIGKKSKDLVNRFFQTSQKISQLLLSEKDPVKKRRTASKVENSSLYLANVLLENHESVPSNEKTEVLTKLLGSFENIGPPLASALDKGEVRAVKKTNLEMISSNVDLSQDGKLLTFVFTANSITFPKSSLSNLSYASDGLAVSCMVLRKSGDSFLGLFRSKYRNFREDGQLEPEKIINTDVLMVSVERGSKTTERIPMRDKFTMTLKIHQTSDVTDPVCFALHPGDTVPTSRGCTASQLNSTHVQCACDHLTSFVVLMSVTRDDAIVEDLALSVLTDVCSIVSVFFLLLSYLTFVMCPNLKSDRNTIHANMTACMGLGQLLFVVGVDQVANRVVCAVIAGFLHYLFMATFCWMSIEGLQLYFKLVIIFSSSRSLQPVFYGVGYGVPAIIVAVSAGVNSQGYGTKKNCWLSTEKWFHFSFIGPVLLIILWNIVMLSIALKVMCRHYASPSKKEISRIQKLRAQLKGVVSLLVLLGVTWLFGLLNFGDSSSIVFAYLFVLLNGSQGVFIFFFHCFFNDKVRKEYWRWLRNATYLPDCITGLCVAILRTESRQDLSKSTGTSSQAKGTLSSWKKQEVSKLTEFETESISQKDDVADMSSSGPKPKLVARPETALTGFAMTDIKVPETTAEMLMESGIYLGEKHQGHFEMKDVKVPEIPEDMVRDSGIYLGDSRSFKFMMTDVPVPETTELKVMDSGVYLGEKPGSSSKKTNVPKSKPKALKKISKSEVLDWKTKAVKKISMTYVPESETKDETKVSTVDQEKPHKAAFTSFDVAVPDITETDARDAGIYLGEPLGKAAISRFSALFLPEVLTENTTLVTVQDHVSQESEAKESDIREKETDHISQESEAKENDLQENKTGTKTALGYLSMFLKATQDSEERASTLENESQEGQHQPKEVPDNNGEQQPEK